MTEATTTIPIDVIRREIAIGRAKGAIGYFRRVAPLTEPNTTEYLSWLNLIEDELPRARQKRIRAKTAPFFYFPNKHRAIELYFTPDSIAWVWNNGKGGVNTYATRQSVRFFLEDEKPQLQLTIEKFANREERKRKKPLSTTSITIGDEETVLLSVNGQEEQVPMDKALPLFPKPNGHGLTSQPV